jgi:hypothetical protein
MKEPLLFHREMEKYGAMTCQEFEAALVEVACDRPLEAAARGRALKHTAQCAPCARRLADQRALTARILEFSMATENLRAPADIRERLRATVAELRPAQTAPNQRLIPVPVTLIHSGRRMNWVRRGLAAVATILALFMSTAVWRRYSMAPVQTALMGSQLASTKSLVQTEQPGGPIKSGAPVGQIDQAIGRPAQRDKSNLRTRRGLKKAQNGQGGQNGREAGQDEVASEFVPLTPAMDEKAIENGLIVRLEVPRSKLIAMGLPLHLEGQENINTEVVMGENGVAYAIRVVR